MKPAVDAVDVLVVGAGPTGLTLVGRLAAFGATVRIVDDKAGPVAQSRALAIQPRTLEVLRGPVADRLLEEGNRTVQMHWHSGDRTRALPLFDLGMDDTAFPFLLFLSQARTEAILVEQVAGQDVAVEWQTRFVGFDRDVEQDWLVCRLSSGSGDEEVRAKYLVGCDGAHSQVRKAAGIRFVGGRYPQTFLLADGDATGLDPGAAHVWMGAGGPAFFFPLRTPAAWRFLTARERSSIDDPPEGSTRPVQQTELDAAVARATGDRVRIVDPIWSTAFRISHRQASSYQAGRVFLAGDAAHVHSPAGAQGMNTGIQDSVNLGWKLGLVCTGRAPAHLLDTYEQERRPVGESVLRFTDRATTAATSTAVPVRLLRTHVAPAALALSVHLPRLRGAAFHTIAQLSIRYPDVMAAAGPLASPEHQTTRVRAWVSRLARPPRPRAGERLLDLRMNVDGKETWLHDLLSRDCFDLLVCGPIGIFDGEQLDLLATRYAGLLRIHILDTADAPGLASGRRRGPIGSVLTPEGRRRLGIRDCAQILVRPDGHVAFRRDHADLADLSEFLRGWLVSDDPTT